MSGEDDNNQQRLTQMCEIGKINGQEGGGGSRKLLTTYDCFFNYCQVNGLKIKLLKFVEK